MQGSLYGVGVGPGDARLMTCLAVEVIEKCPVIAVPGGEKEFVVSYQIAGKMIKGLDQKECLCLSSPMTKAKDVLNAAYQSGAEKIMEQLRQGKDVAYLTLGDPTVYSTYIYIHRLVRQQGFHAEIINGVPSFLAASARLSDSLADRSEQIHIIPASYDIEEAMKLPGTKVLMKAASKMPEVKNRLISHGASACMVENCGMADERVYYTVQEIPEEAGYYSLVIVRERTDENLE